MSTGELTERTHRQEPLINSRTDASLDLIGLAPTTRTSITVTWPSQNTNSPTRPSRGQRHQTCAPPANLQLVINGERNLKNEPQRCNQEVCLNFAFWHHAAIGASTQPHRITLSKLSSCNLGTEAFGVTTTWDPKKKTLQKKTHNHYTVQ